MIKEDVEKKIKESLKRLKIIVVILVLIIVIAGSWFYLNSTNERSYQQGVIDGSQSIVGTILQGVATCQPFEITFQDQQFQLTDVRCLQNG